VNGTASARSPPQLNPLFFPSLIVSGILGKLSEDDAPVSSFRALPCGNSSALVLAYDFSSNEIKLSTLVQAHVGDEGGGNIKGDYFTALLIRRFVDPRSRSAFREIAAGHGKPLHPLPCGRDGPLIELR
jgi:hypothetical protein